MHRETPLTTAGDIPGECVGDERADQHDQQHPSVGREHPCKQANYRGRGQYQSQSGHPAIEAVPFDREWLHEQAVHRRIQRRNRVATDLRPHVGGGAHRLFGWKPLAVTVVAGVIVDGVEGIAGRNGATDQVRAEDYRADDRRDGDCLCSGATRVGGVIEQEPAKCREHEGQCGDAGQTRDRGRQSHERAVHSRRVLSTTDKGPRGKRDGRHEHIIAPAIDRPGNQVVLNRDEEREPDASRARQHNRAKQVGGEDRENRPGRGCEADGHILIRQEP